MNTTGKTQGNWLLIMLVSLVILAFNQGAITLQDDSYDGRTDTLYTLADNRPPKVIPFRNKGQQRQVDYIYQWAAVAERESKECGVPMSVILAQAVLESASGTSWAARSKHNHFGIKSGAWYKRYNSAETCWADYSRVLNLKQYEPLRDSCKTPYQWACGLEKVYAEKKGYAGSLIEIIKKYDLCDYDLR